MHVCQEVPASSTAVYGCRPGCRLAVWGSTHEAHGARSLAWRGILHLPYLLRSACHVRTMRVLETARNHNLTFTFLQPNALFL